MSRSFRNIFLTGPNITHGKAVFCFIYKYRQRWAVVAEEILKRLGKQHKVIEYYAEKGFMLKDLSCCGDSCACCKIPLPTPPTPYEVTVTEHVNMTISAEHTYYLLCTSIKPTPTDVNVTTHLLCGFVCFNFRTSIRDDAKARGVDLIRRRCGRLKVGRLVWFYSSAKVAKISYEYTVRVSV